MSAGIRYGLFLGLGMVLLFDVAPQPTGAVAFWALQTVQLTIYSAVTWRRTGLVVSTVGGGGAALASFVLMVLHAAGYSWSTFPKPWAWVVYVLIAMVPVSVIAESKIHGSEWNRWKRHMEGMGLTDVLLMRHIPNLHQRDA